MKKTDDSSSSAATPVPPATPGGGSSIYSPYAESPENVDGHSQSKLLKTDWQHFAQ